jgi:uncharacterized repeat protein (TIGR03803 family)
VTNPAQCPKFVLSCSLRRTTIGLALVCTLAIVAMHPAFAQTFTVIHVFTGAGDGSNPAGGLTVAGSGALYGTSSSGGNNGYGVIFKLVQRGSGWVLSPLYEFAAASDGRNPYGGVVIGPNGALYGTTAQGGSAQRGTVFALRPPLRPCTAAQCYWNETILHSFTGSPDGSNPAYENLTSDQAGTIYGTTHSGGTSNDGVVFQLAQSGGQWTEAILHSFGDNDGALPEAGVIFDAAGNLYGTTLRGGTGGNCQGGCGIAYQLSPANGSWTEHTLVNFDPELSGANPFSTLSADQSGNLFGTTSIGGGRGGGTVFELTPSDGSFSLSVPFGFGINPACNPHSGVTMDPAGNLYGVCYSGGAHGAGMVFKLTNSNMGWMLTALHDFGGSDGSNPWGPVVLDASGNVYGTAYQGGNTGGACGGFGCGVVWEITP